MPPPHAASFGPLLLGLHCLFFLSRSVNQFALPLDRVSSTSACYPRRGAGVTVWIIDGGCVPNHEEFTPGQVTTRALPSSPFDPAGIDDKGHGSHVAGTVGGWRTGVAPNVTLSCIKVMDSEGHGKRSVIAAGWEAVAAAKVADPTRPMVMQASLSGSGTHHDVAMERLAAVGVIPIVSAGNTGGSSCDRTPARSPNAITVANADIDDTLYRSSSRGRCVDMIARTLKSSGRFCCGGTSLVLLARGRHCHDLYPSLRSGRPRRCVVAHPCLFNR